MERQSDQYGGDATYTKWRGAILSSDVIMTLRRNVELLPAIGAAFLLLVAANIGLESFAPPGLYLEMSRAIQNAGYGIPETVPYVTADGLPFAYPPLGFYIIAVLQDFTPLSYLHAAVVMTWIEFVLFGLLAGLFARTFFQASSRWHTVVASVLIVVTPAIYFWQLLPPAGSIRMLGMLFLVTGLLFGLKLFRDGERSALLPALGCFAGTILSHPTYIPLFGLSFIVFYLVYDRSPTGLFWGAVVAIGGLLVTAPWWLLIISRHGPEVFIHAAGTHEGGGKARTLRSVVAILVPIDGRFISLRMFSLAFIGGLYCLVRRRFLLPVWILTISFVLPKARFVAFIEALLVTVAICGIVLPAMRDHQLPIDRLLNAVPLSRKRLPNVEVVSRHAVVTSVVMVVLLGALASGGAYAYTHQRTGPSTAFYDATDWLHEETPQDATIVAYTHTGRVPFYAERTTLNVPWGTEWEGEGAFQRYKYRNAQIRQCSGPACLSNRLSEYGYHPNYIVAPTGAIDVNRFNDSPRYQAVHSNEEYVILKLIDSDVSN